MLANPGITGEGYIIPSYYGQCDEHGSLSGTLWLLVAGSAEVKNVGGKLYIKVNALNSYDVPVHIVYDGTNGAAVDQVAGPEATAQKHLRDGQLIILRDGKVYNALGMEM